VLNGVGMPKRPEITIADFSKAVEAEPLALVPFDAKMFGMASNNGQMIAELEDGDKIAQIFSDIARAVTGRAPIKRERKGFLEPLLAFVKG
jgi:pilus assembly protein CpaE